MNTEDKIKVSIIVPVYNVERYLGKCLDSLVNQTLKDIEIICVNDGSTDNSADILKTYSDKDNRIIVISQENSGQSVARNKGIDIAKGEFIGFVDSDDWVDENYFEALYNEALKSNSDIAVAGMIRITGPKQRKFLIFKDLLVTDNLNLKFELCDVPEKSYVWNKIYKTEKIKKCGLKFEDGIIFEDCIFTPQVLFFLEKMVTVPNIYYHYFRRSNSTVRQRNKKANQDSIYAHKKAKDFIREHNIDISSHEPKTYRFKVFGITLFKVREKGSKKQYSLFNIFKFGKI